MVAQTVELVECFPISQIIKDPAIQSRVSIDPNTVNDYAERMAAGDKFPGVVLFRDDDHPDVPHYLADGWHRAEAADAAGLENIRAEVRAGSKRDAALWAAGANARHGLRRTNADKRRAVGMVLDDALCANWTNREVAEAVGVSHTLVGIVKHERESGNISKPGALPATNGHAAAPCEAADPFDFDSEAETATETGDATEAVARRPRKPRKPILDGLGNPVPPALEGLWSEMRRWHELNWATKNVLKMLRDLMNCSPVGRRVRESDIVELKSRFAILRNNLMPYCPCPQPGCRGEVGNDECQSCCGSGWIPRTLYRNVVPELRWPENGASDETEGDE